jgi:hypothetical protein
MVITINPLGVLYKMANIKGKNNNSTFVMWLALLLFSIAGCNQDMDNDSENAGPWPDYAVAADALTNNLMNAGYIVGYDDTTFFSFRNGDKAVYKIDERGNTSKVYDGIQASQLLVNGQCVFIIDHEHYPDSSFEIYRFEPDRSSIQLVHQDNRQMFGVSCDDNWIYYCINNIITCHGDDPPPGEEPRMYYYYILYKIDHEGKEVHRVLNYINDINLPYISDGWLYYSYNPPEWAVEQENLADRERGLYKIKLDGTGKTRLLDTIPFSPIVKKGNWLLYSLDGIYRLNIDGSEPVKLCDDHAAKLNIKDQWIYYTTFDDNISLYRIDWDGNNRQKVSVKERVQDVCIIGDWVYFHVDQGRTWSLYRIKIDGTEEEKIEISL